MIVSRDIKFIEIKKWNFKYAKRNASEEIVQDLGDYINEAPVRGTRLLDDIYQSCNVVVLEPIQFEEAKNDPKWIDAMKEELRMIEKNQTRELMDMPKQKKPIGVK